MKAKMNLFVKTELDEWDHPTKNIPNVSNVISEFEHKEDPHGVIPVGWVLPGQYKVVCFHGDKDLLGLMVGVKYKNCTGRYSAGLDYINVLKDYLIHVDYMEILHAQDEWRSKGIEEFLKGINHTKK